MNPAITSAFVLGAYLLGSVPFGLVLARAFAGTDVRQMGSGNIGASNVARTAGKGVGVLTLILDAAKAAVPMLIAKGVLARTGGASPQAWAVAVGLAAFLGHIYPVWLGFRGGKGVATALGMFLVIAPVPALVGVAVFALAYGLTRVAAVGSLAATVVCCAGTLVQAFTAYGPHAMRTAVPWAALAVTVLIALRHRSNIARLLQGTENKV
jgi:glycerol-3-phosphate acyltransferase PlsY